VYVAAFRQAGVIPVKTLRDAFNLAELLASEGYPQGNRAIAVTSAGGFAVLASDYAETHGIDMVDLPEDVFRELNVFLPSCWNHANPMDIIGDADAARFAALFDVLIQHQDFWDIATVSGAACASSGVAGSRTSPSLRMRSRRWGISSMSGPPGRVSAPALPRSTGVRAAGGNTALPGIPVIFYISPRIPADGNAKPIPREMRRCCLRR
jgi:hypothetical protein